MKKIKNEMECQSLTPRMFTFNQLLKISDDNYGVLNRSIDMSFFKENDVFLLEPIMVHEFAFGELTNPHLRTYVSVLNGQCHVALQDITFEQWEQGQEMMRIAS